MKKITGSIVDAKFALIGFKVKGTGKDFGELGTTQIEKIVSLNYMMKTNFNNSQAYFNNGSITEKGGFHIRNLPMQMYSGGVFTNIKNTITLTSRYVHENENIGFGVLLGDTLEEKYKYNDVIKLTELFKPINFIVRVNEKGKVYIAGKPGYPLSSLPEIPLGNAGTNKKTKSGAKESTPVTGNLINDIDIIDIFEFVKSYNGFIINFKDSDYVATGDTYEKKNERFKSLDIGEVANPDLVLSETKFNASCRFKNPGIVTIDNDSDQPVFAGATNNMIYTYVYRTKNIFYNGENHMKKLGIIVPDDAVDAVYDKFGKSLAVIEITDKKVISIVNQLINWKNSRIFEVDVSKLALISPNKYDSYILDDMGIYKNTLNLAEAKLCMIYVRGALKQLASMGYVAPPKNKEIAQQFVLRTPEEIDKIIDAGVNVFDGSFNEPGETVYNKDKPKDKAPEVRYIIEGLDPKNYNYSKLLDPDKCPDAVAKMIDRLQDVGTINDKAKILNSMQVELEKVQYSAIRKLWFHKTSMWLKANKLGVHKDDAGHWELNDKKRTTAICYDNTLPKCKGLQVLLLNTDIIGK